LDAGALDLPVESNEAESPGVTLDNAALPSDWVETVDPSSGQVYYYNTATEETSWEKPSPHGSGKQQGTLCEGDINSGAALN
jgi:hypothetical protein